VLEHPSATRQEIELAQHLLSQLPLRLENVHLPFQDLLEGLLDRERVVT
jgi:hypothetical protein